MPTRQYIHYRPGGYDPIAPDHNIDWIETVDVSQDVVNQDTIEAGAQSGWQDAATQLRAYRALVSPTNAQTVAAVKLICLILLRVGHIILNRFEDAD